MDTALALQDYGLIGVTLLLAIILANVILVLVKKKFGLNSVDTVACNWGKADRDVVWGNMSKTQNKLDRCAEDLHDACENMRSHDTDAKKWMVGMEGRENRMLEMLDKLVTLMTELVAVTKKNGHRK